MRQNDAVYGAVAVETNGLTIEPETELESAFEAGETDEELPETDETRRLKTEFRRQSDSKVVDWAVIGDEFHLSMDSESAGDWMTTVSATRRAVLEGERLWKIPTNWEHLARIKNEDGVDEILYDIRESSVYVVVLDSEQGLRANAGYEVASVGNLVVEVEDSPDKTALNEMIADVEEDEDRSSELRERLQQLLETWERFVGRYRAHYYKWGDKGAWAEFTSEGETTLNAWSIEPLEQGTDINQVVNFMRGSRSGPGEPIGKLLIEAGVIPPSPSIALTVKDGGQLPVGYRVQALTEAGCTPSEVVDYLMDRFQGESYRSWDSDRSVDESTIRENLISARANLEP